MHRGKVIEQFTKHYLNGDVLPLMFLNGRRTPSVGMESTEIGTREKLMSLINPAAGITLNFSAKNKPNPTFNHMCSIFRCLTSCHKDRWTDTTKTLVSRHYYHYY